MAGCVISTGSPRPATIAPESSRSVGWPTPAVGGTTSTGWQNWSTSRGALLFLDAIQALGVFPLDVRRTPIDFLAADGHKWLLGPEGAGIFFTRREHLDLLRPVGVGWNSVRGHADFSRIELVFRDTAARYEGGSQNVAGLSALGASLELLSGFGMEAISRRVLEITDLACQRLEEIGAVIHSDRSPASKSGIVSFELPGRDPIALRRQCAPAAGAAELPGGPAAHQPPRL